MRKKLTFGADAPARPSASSGSAARAAALRRRQGSRLVAERFDDGMALLRGAGVGPIPIWPLTRRRCGCLGAGSGGAAGRRAPFRTPDLNIGGRGAKRAETQNSKEAGGGRE